ncbi:cytochrome c biogenesis protein CcsA [Opitutus sp. ER46]|uniref:cytochrome c biogenesis protein n=1 Tax=Opitutus sp. ER46 TaxID=2161864 RepID=UPI000D306B02|nr:cytochrome c biogenesis protein CcsA [Opitutus sp. ER46]PTX91600.1 cytochrome C biogenesis protein [Opitutus sp. ER46]
MKKLFAPALVFLAVLVVGFTLLAPRNPDEYDVVGFSRLPTLVNGRVKPLDTVARTTLLVLQGRQTVRTLEGRRLTPAEWLLDVLYRPEQASTYPVFEIVNPDLLALLDLTPEQGVRGKRFSAAQFSPRLAELDRQARLADDVAANTRTGFQQAVVQLRSAVILYQRLQASLMPPGDAHYFEQFAKLPAALNGPRAPGMNRPQDPAAAQLVLELNRAFTVMDADGYLRPIPGAGDMANLAAWQTEGGSLAASVASGQFNPAALTYADLGRAWRDRQPEAFNRAVRDYRGRLESGIPALLRKCDVEWRFNGAQPFYSSMLIYVVAFLAAVVSWLRWPEALGRVAFGLVALAFVVSTVGILTRMWLEARPPVTNLYSSALFVGWGAVALCLVLERMHRNAIGSAAAGLIGFASLLVAHHLALGGDTLEMMRAVLDSNFWLATHVVTIAVGYSATFLAGFLAIIYVLRGVLTRSLDPRTADALARMIYGIVCFATLFSFIGTVLGGIWADQSWGRFWGWDPKENGALILVLWNAVILHARWGGLVRQRGLAVLAIAGNIVTAWSWFGVNMLGVGLHSYGFMNSAFWALIGFVASQVALIALAGVPLAHWRSFRAGPAAQG